MALHLVLLAALAAAMIRAAMLQGRVGRLEQQAVTDPLTGVFNRRQMHDTLATAIERRQRSGERASLLLLDVDRFKDINDAFGHAAGDRVLTMLVAVVGGRMRRVDALFRAGGEEFVLLLTGAKFADALSVAEEVRRTVQDTRFVPGHRVSISVGVVELAYEQSVADWLAEADAALFRAKRAGRNRVAGRPLNSARVPSKEHEDNALVFSGANRMRRSG
jgi:diguanylate cyclase (GGDEF)-like protein